MALADEANRYIDEHKPWVLAKQEGAEARLQAVCTQGLNLFRILAAALKPVLPRTGAQAEGFLAAPVSRWEDIAAPLTAHRIQPYVPLFTRIDPKLIDAMTEASKDTLAPAASPTVGATSVATPQPAGKSVATDVAPTKEKESGVIGIDDFARLDLRIGKVLECGFVEGSDKLLRFLLDSRRTRPAADLLGHPRQLWRAGEAGRPQRGVHRQPRAAQDALRPQRGNDPVGRLRRRRAGAAGR